MSERFEAEGVTLIMGDCVDIIPTLSGIDAMITDPPYGIGFSHGGNDRSGIGKGRYSTKFNGVKIIGDESPFDPIPILGGRHYTGDIHHHGDRKVEMTRRLSAKEAKQYAEEMGRLWLARQRITNKFETLESLERAAVKWCKENLKSPWLLLENDALNPNRAIAGEGWIVERIPVINELAKAWDKVPNRLREGRCGIQFIAHGTPS